jgi:hypothetical protein
MFGIVTGFDEPAQLALFRNSPSALISRNHFRLRWQGEAPAVTGMRSLKLRSELRRHVDQLRTAGFGFVS